MDEGLELVKQMVEIQHKIDTVDAIARAHWRLIGPRKPRHILCHCQKCASIKQED